MPVDQRYRQSNDVVVTTLNPPYKARSIALNGVGSCLVHWLAGRNIRRDFVFGDGVE